MDRVARKFFSGIKGLIIFLAISNCSPTRRNHVGNISSTINVQETMTKGFGDSPLLRTLLNGHPQFFDSILLQKKELNVQIIYTQIDRDKKGHRVFADHYYNVDTSRYFYPASTVKLPVALLALQRLNELKKKGVNRQSAMITEANSDEQTTVTNDTSSADGRPTIAHYIKKIFLVSDNDAFNRLYEFLGQEYINDRLHQMGFRDIQIIHRLSVVLNEEQNRHTNPVRFLDAGGNSIYVQPALKSKLNYAQRNTRLGKGYMKDDEQIPQPFDFSEKNRMSLPDLHSIMRCVIFPDAVSAKKRFRLTADDYQLLYRYMSMYPRESDFPSYDTTEYPDNYTKIFLYGNDIKKADPAIRIFSKSGTAYGFLTETAYIVDYKNNIEFFLTATIYCNSDGIFNDDKYDYDAVGYPFLKNLGRVVYEYELKRKAIRL
jgi:hypothetical protein